MISLAFIINLLVTLLLVAYGWFVQLVYFPSMAYWKRDDEKKTRFYKDRMLLFTFPLMSLEVLTSIAILLGFTFKPTPGPSDNYYFNLYGVAFIFIILIYITSFQLIRPLINRFLKNGDFKALQQAVAWNWVRTLGWTIRFIVLFVTLISKSTA